MNVVRYERTFPLLWQCGCYDTDGLLVHAEYQKGDWIYTSILDVPADSGQRPLIVAALNLKTGETISIPDPSVTSVDAATFAPFLQRGLAVDDADRFVPDTALKGLKGLSMQNESCLDFTVAFYLLFVLWLVIAPFAIRSHRKKTAIPPMPAEG